MAMEITIRIGDVTDDGLGVDAIVNAANPELWMGSGVAGAIKRKGGVVIEQEAIAKGPIKAGEALTTRAGSLKAQWVIHAAAIDGSGNTSIEMVRHATFSSLMCAEDEGAESIAFPALATGVGGMGMIKSAQAMREGLNDFLAMRPQGRLHRVVFVLYEVTSYNAFLKVFQDMMGNS